MWGIDVAENYQVHANITYNTVTNFDVKLDLFVPISAESTTPAVLYMHGGGWMSGSSKETSVLETLPFLQLGWAVANVEYRSSSIALAPAAVEDCLCAFRWVARNAHRYNIDAERIVVMGHSAGGHLALTTGMIPLSSSGLSAPCAFEDMYLSSPNVRPRPPLELAPAAIVNWYGITDVFDLSDGPNEQGYAVKWLGNQPERLAIAKAVSPVNYVRDGLPPTISIHGERDCLVPYDQAVRLHMALGKFGVTNKLVTIPAGGHGNFGVEVTRRAYGEVFQFLRSAGLQIGAFEEKVSMGTPGST